VVVFAYFNLKPIKVKKNNPFQDEKYEEKLMFSRNARMALIFSELHFVNSLSLHGKAVQ